MSCTNRTTTLNLKCGDFLWTMFKKSVLPVKGWEMEDGFTTAYILYIHIEKREHVWLLLICNDFLKINLFLKQASYSQTLVKLKIFPMSLKIEKKKSNPYFGTKCGIQALIKSHFCPFLVLFSSNFTVRKANKEILKYYTCCSKKENILNFLQYLKHWQKQTLGCHKINIMRTWMTTRRLK